MAGINKAGSLTGTCIPIDDGSRRTAAIVVVNAYHISQEQSVETSLLEYPGKLDPRVEFSVVGLSRIVSHPQSMLNMRHTVHVEGIEQHSSLCTHNHAPFMSYLIHPCRVGHLSMGLIRSMFYASIVTSSNSIWSLYGSLVSFFTYQTTDKSERKIIDHRGRVSQPLAVADSS